MVLGLRDTVMLSGTMPCAKIASLPGFLASGKDSRTKVVLARKLEKQGLGTTPATDVPVQFSPFCEIQDEKPQDDD